jgi:aryl-alcohol dehydrogenase-like predicted oxidoreductase
MKLYEIPGVKRPVSQLILGTDYFNPEIFEQVSEMLEAFLAIGGNTLDTAHIYGGGKSEIAIGQWLSQGPRDRINIFTKGAHHDSKGPRVNPDAIKQDLYTSLERLKTDYIELYGLHRDDPNIPVGMIIEALNQHIEEGHIQAIGASNWTWQRLQEANQYAQENGLIGFSFSSPNLSLAKPNEPRWKDCVSVDEETISWHEQSKLPIFSWSSQAGGFFSGRFSPEVTDNKEMVRVYYSDANWERLRRCNELAAKKGVEPIQISLAYVLNQSFPTAALVGPRTVAELHSSAEAIHIELSQEESDWLDLRGE